MTEPAPFARADFYVSLGESIFGQKRLGLYIGMEPPADLVFKPLIDQKYVTRKMFSFAAPKKTPYAAIISNLNTSGIIPSSGFDPPRNPDNKYYVDLPYDRYDDIVNILRITISGTTLGPDMLPRYNEYTVPEVDRDLAKSTAIIPALTLGEPSAIILDKYKQDTSPRVHKFTETTGGKSRNKKKPMSPRLT